MNKLHGCEEKRKHYLQQGGPKTRLTRALRLTSFAQMLRYFAKPETVIRHFALGNDEKEDKL